jgi:hypothetical protein
MPKARRRPAAPVDLASVPWDTSTPEQRQGRAYRVTERGDIDPNTGKIINPNGVKGVRFNGNLDDLRAAGHLTDWHLDVAEAYEALCRAVRGPAAQRSCLDFSPVGHDDHDTDPRDVRRHRDCLNALGVFQRAELDRVVWEQAPPSMRRLPLLVAALDAVGRALDMEEKRG